VILDLLADGSVNLTTIRLLSPHLTPDNHQAILAEATGMTRRQVDKLVARLAPQADVAPSIRKLPVPKPGAGSAPTPPTSEPVTRPLAQRRERAGREANDGAPIPPPQRHPVIVPLL
jgi:hypothetical protein